MLNQYTTKKTVNPALIKKVVATTERVKKLVEEWEKAPALVTSDSSRYFTESWLQTESDPLDIRWAKAYANHLTKSPIAIWDGELIVGNQTKCRKGVDIIAAFMPLGVLRQLKEKKMSRQMSDSTAAGIDAGDEEVLLKDAEYWAEHLMPEYELEALKQVFGEDHFAALDDEGRVIEGPLPKARPMRAGIASMFGSTPDPHVEVMNTGLVEIKRRAQERMEAMMESGAGLGVTDAEGYKKILLWRAMIIVCDAIMDWAHQYSDLAAKKAKEERDPQRKKELLKIAEVCARVPAYPPQDYWEALQSLRFIHLAIRKEVPQRTQVTLGRVDQYLYPYYAQGLADKTLTRQQAAELLACFWLKTREGEAVSIQEKGREGGATPGSLLVHATVGGRDECGRDVTNEVSWLILEVMRQMKLSEPSVYVRYHAEMDESFLLFALECNRDFRGGSPAFLNDSLGTARNLERGVKLEDAVDWYASGCLGYNINSVERSAGATNLNNVKILELALNNGYDHRKQCQLGPKTGEAADFQSLEDIKQAFYKQFDFFAERQRKDYFIRRSTQLMTSPRSGLSAVMLFDDAIATGKAQCDGGARYPAFQQWWMGDRGVVDVADSLAAIRKLVFDDKIVSLPELVAVMNNNWEGREDLRRMCLNVVKFGNDDDYVDEIYNEVLLRTQSILQSRPDPFTGLKPFLYKGAAAGHIIMGEVCGASANGRCQGTPLADGGTSAMPSMDVNGPSALVNSASKIVSAWEYAGCVHNMKFPVTLLDSPEKLKAVLALVRQFFARGGWHIQFNILDTEELLDAKIHPEDHGHIVVRISGFCAYFVDLPESLQDEIIGRTLHNI